MLEILYHHAKFGGARISPAAGVAKNVEFGLTGCGLRSKLNTGKFALRAMLPVIRILYAHYRQHCAQRKPAGISFTQRPILRFFARRGDTLHRWG